MKRVVILGLLIICVIGGFSFVSCSKEKKEKEMAHEGGESGMAAGWKFTLPQGDPMQGRQIFVALECFKCHEVKGESFPTVSQAEKGVGPELSQMAGMHPVEFFAESIMNPNAVIDPDSKEKGYLGNDGKSKMPNYNDILTIRQVADMAAYLASLKTEERKAH